VYGVEPLSTISDAFLASCDCAVIASPSPTHAEYLLRFMEAGIRLIVCEKPLCTNHDQLRLLTRAAASVESRIVINYTRRFQPAYQRLAKIVQREIARDKLTAVSIRYQRGFLNNASHAFDLLQFLTRQPIGDACLSVTAGVHDEFPDDPTITASGRFADASLTLVGIPHARFSLFEIDLFFRHAAIRIHDRGNAATIWKSSRSGASGYYGPLRFASRHVRLQAKPFVHLYRHIDRMLGDSAIPDNWAESVNLTSWMLDVLYRV
jgi:predicted dehydrogenase